MTRNAFRSLPALLGAALALPTLLAAQTPDGRENSAPTPTYWASGLSPASLNQLVSQGWRATTIQVDTTSPWTFTVAMVQNAGSYLTTWSWVHDVDAATLSLLAQQQNARLVDVEAVDTGAGSTRYAAILVDNTGANQKTWNWLGDTTQAAIGNLVNQGKRVVDLEQYTVGGQTRYACVTVDNVGADARSWWYYYGVTATNLTQLLAQNSARVYDLDREGNVYNVVMIAQAGQAGTWRYSGLSGTQVSDTLAQNGARILDVTRYSTLLGTRYEVVMGTNTNPVETRVNALMRNNTDGVSGLFLKRLGTGQLAAINADRVHEPAGAITLLHNYEAIRLVNTNATTMNSVHRTYTAGGPTSCPGNSGAFVDESLTAVLTAMMQAEDTTRTRTATQLVGGFFPLNFRAGQIGMTSTQVNHHVGCQTPANATTLRDLAIVHEIVGSGGLGDDFYNFYSRLSIDIGPGGFGAGAFEAMLAAEAASVGLSTAQFDAWKSRLQVFWHKGAYGLPTGFNHATTAFVRMPALEGGQIVTRKYAVGTFVADASNDAGAAAAARLGVSEVLREEVRSSMQSLLGVPLASSTQIGVSCGGSSAMFHGTNPPQLALNALHHCTDPFPSSPLVLAIGFSSTSANGVALPFDLSLIGAQPGCMAYTDLTITSARLAGGAGNSVTEVVSVPPGIANAGFTYYTQWYSFDALGGQPFKTSNARRNVVGF